MSEVTGNMTFLDNSRIELDICGSMHYEYSTDNKLVFTSSFSDSEAVQCDDGNLNLLKNDVHAALDDMNE